MVRAQNTSVGEGLYFKCPDVWMGKPVARDCDLLTQQLPQFEGSPSELTDRRMFVEPQYLDPPFAKLDNLFDLEIEQIPKVYRAR